MGSITNGQRVGRYKLVQMLGEGGMGTVWLAHPLDDPNQLYAVKSVSPQFARDPAVCGMFVKEASLAAALDHPNVVRLYDVGIHDEVPFFVMEWVDGFSLRDVAKAVVETGERVPPSIALRIGSDMCGGLHAAHELCGDDGEHLGLVHRDISPHNVLVTRDGVSKIIDFGVAKARDLATSENEESVVGGLKGKVRYMAPEQALERDIDRRADIFSVGAVLYQLLTGRAPFEGPNEMAIINALMSTNPVYVPDDLPEPVQWILRRALARRPENRFNDASEMQNAIELALVEMGAPDKHYDVVECLNWFVPLGPPPEWVTSSHRHLNVAEVHHDDELGTPVRSTNSPPPLAFAGDAATADGVSIQRRLSMIDNDEIAMMQRSRKSSGGGAARFLLIGAAALVVLGGGIAYAMRDDPPKDDDWGTKKTGTQPTADPIAPPIPSAGATATSTPSTPVIDFGDVEEKTDDPAKKKKKRKPKPVDSTGGATTAPATAPAPAGQKPGDLAGPVKVWK